MRTTFGGRAREGGPVVTYTIIAICAVIELLRYLAPSFYYGTLMPELIFAPRFGLTEPYRFLTSTFLHGGALHLAFNMYALWLVGGQLERLLGRARYLTLYLLAALGGSVGYLAIAGVGAPGAVGASGGVFGLFAAYAVFIKRLGGNPQQILIVIAINVVFGFVVSGIAWQAHLGGMVIGAVVAVIFSRIRVQPARPSPSQLGGQPGRPGSAISGATLQWVACAAVLVALAVIVALVYSLS